MVLIILTNIKTYYYENIIVNNFILENIFNIFVICLIFQYMTENKTENLDVK